MGETVKRHFLQPFLLPLTDQRCRLGILTLLRHVFDKKLVCDHILSRIQQNTFRRKAVPACSSGLLIIAFHVFRHIIMDDVPHIRFIDSHTKSVCRYHDLLPVINKIFLVFLPFQVRETRMVSCDRISFLLEFLTDLLHIFSGQTVECSAVPEGTRLCHGGPVQDNLCCSGTPSDTGIFVRGAVDGNFDD